MHEMGVTRDIVNAVLEHAEHVGATSVRTVYLRIGYGRDIVESLLTGAFAYMSRGTVLEGAELVIERVPFMVRCKECGLIYHIDVHDDSTLPCPCCGKKSYALHSGMEFSIESIEVAGCAKGPQRKAS